MSVTSVTAHPCKRQTAIIIIIEQISHGLLANKQSFTSSSSSESLKNWITPFSLLNTSDEVYAVW